MKRPARDAGILPPGGFIAYAVHQSIMDSTERHRVGLNRSVMARPIQPIEAAAIFEVRYTGAAPKILLDGDEVKSGVRTGPDGKSMIAAVDARLGANNRIEVSALPGTRVRMIGL